MWEQLNALFLRLQAGARGRHAGRRARITSSRMVIEGVHLFQGITDATMGHGEGWQYLQVGPLSRACRRDGGARRLCTSDRRVDGCRRRASCEWVGLLRSCSALEAYCRRYTADLRPERDRGVPAAERRLSAVGPVRGRARRSRRCGRSRSSRGRGAGGRAERLAGRLHASLDYGQVDEILSDDPHAYLEGIGRHCAQIHTALYQSYITYPIEVGAAGLTPVEPCTTPSGTSPGSPTRRRISESVMEARMQPRSDAAQRCLHFGLSTTPASRVMMYQDHDGNIVHHFNIPGRHSRLTVTAEALVECATAGRCPGRARARRLGATRRR